MKKKKSEPANNLGARSAILLPNHTVTFPQWSKPAPSMDTINPTAEQPEHAETSHQKKNIAALSSHIYTMK